MPVYCFTTDDEPKVTIERIFKMDKCPGWVLTDDGRPALRNLSAETKGGTRIPANWPMHSDAAGVAESQVKEAEAHSQSIGVPTHFTPDGRATFTDAKHRKTYCEKVGLYDRNGGYEDPQKQR